MLTTDYTDVTDKTYRESVLSVASVVKESFSHAAATGMIAADDVNASLS
jgi:hypothetical protein